MTKSTLKDRYGTKLGNYLKLTVEDAPSSLKNPGKAAWDKA
jgi:hypothetical protein